MPPAQHGSGHYPQAQPVHSAHGPPVAGPVPPAGDGSGANAVSGMSLATRTGANLARSQLLAVLNSVQQAYQKTNTPAAPTALGNNSGRASSYLQNQISNGTLALNLLT